MGIDKIAGAGIAGRSFAPTQIEREPVPVAQRRVTFTGSRIRGEPQVVKEKPPKPEDLAKKLIQRKDEIPTGRFQIKAGPDGKVSIKLLNISPSINFQRVSMNDLMGLLGKLNLPLSGENMSLAKELLLFNLSLTKETMQDVKMALSFLPRRTADDLSAAVFMKLKGINITPENAKSIQTLFADKPQLGEQMAKLGKMLNYFSNSRLSDAVINSLLSQLVGLAGEMMAKPQKGKKKLRENVQEWAGEVEMESKEGGKLRGTLGKLKSKMENKLAALPEWIEPDEESAWEEAYILLDELYDNLEAQALINKSISGEGEEFYYIQLPLSLRGGETVTVHIKIYTDLVEGYKKGINMDNLTMEFSVETERLGRLDGRVELCGRKVSLEFIAQERTRRLIENKFKLLEKALEGVGYRVNSFKIRALQTEEDFSSYLIKKEFSPDKLASVDVTI